jgi:hypothetical protein
VGWAAAGRGVSLVLLEGVMEGDGRGEYVGDVYMVGVCAALASVYAWWLYMRAWQVYMRTPCFDALGDSEYVSMYEGGMGRTAHMRSSMAGYGLRPTQGVDDPALEHTQTHTISTISHAG